ncbi:hypothetical protein Tco_1350335 [Tanacetum coccineum]
MDSEVVKSKKETEESSKGTEDELKSDKSKKAESSEEKRMEDDKETDEHEEVEVDVEAELKKHLVIVKDDDIAKLMLFHLLSNHQMLQDIDREDLKTLWKLVKIKHGDIRPEDEHERVL